MGDRKLSKTTDTNPVADRKLTKKKTKFRLFGRGNETDSEAEQKPGITFDPEMEQLIQQNKLTQKRSRLLPVGSALDMFQNMAIKIENGFESVQGSRKYMEDRCICITDLKDQVPNGNYPKGFKFSFYAVYDGHAGCRAADICKETLHQNLATQPSFSGGKIRQSIQDALSSVDSLIIEKGTSEGWTEGACVSLALIVDNVLYTANLGDSHIVLAQKRNELEGVILSETHKASEPAEQQRITQAGGMVMRNRLFGDLSISRALGDLNYKKPKQEQNFVSCEAFIQKTSLTPIHEFLILATDGLWDCFTFQEAVDFVSKRLEDNPSLSACEMSKQLVDESQQRGSSDNISVVVLLFNWSDGPNNPL